MSKKIISILLAVVLTLSVFSVTAISASAEETNTNENSAEITSSSVEQTEETTEGTTEETTKYVVVGTESLTGYDWVDTAELAPENVMKKDGDLYTLTYKDVAPGFGGYGYTFRPV